MPRHYAAIGAMRHDIVTPAIIVFALADTPPRLFAAISLPPPVSP